MIKLLKSLLSLFILLLSGYLYCHEGITYTSIGISSSNNSNYLTRENSQNFTIEPILATAKRETKRNHIIYIEEKANEVISFKKYLLFSNKIITPFYSQIATHLFRYTQIDLFFFTHSSFYPFCKSLYLIFEVMRI